MGTRTKTSTKRWLHAAVWLGVLVLVVGLAGTLRPGAEFLGGIPLRRLLAGTAPILRANSASEQHAESRLDALLRGDFAAADALDADLVRLMRAGADPLALVAAVRGVADAPLAAAAGVVLDATPPNPLRALIGEGSTTAEITSATERNLARLDPELRGALEQLIAAVERAASSVRSAGLGAPSRRELAARLAQSFTLRSAPTAADLGAALAVDVDGIERAAIELLRATELARSRLDAGAARAGGLARDLETLPAGDAWPHGLVLALASRAGPVLVSSSETSVIPVRGLAAVIDLGGDDLYTDEGAIAGIADVARDAALVCDIGGDDRYRCAHSGIGAGIGSIAVLVDGDGRDTYAAESPGIGAAILGAAFIVDHAGDDRYDAARFGLGAAAFGCAAVFDVEGDDRYQAEGFALGAAGPAGIAALVDTGGYDLVIVAPPRSTSADEPCVALGAVDNRSGVSPGLGLYFDRKGDDILRVGSGCLGFARGPGLALAIDAFGDDVTATGDWCLGAAEAQGFALYRDLTGSDRIVARRFSLGFARGALAFAIDDAGDDERVSLSSARGVGEDAGSGVFADLDRKGP